MLLRKIMAATALTGICLVALCGCGGGGDLTTTPGGGGDDGGDGGTARYRVQELFPLQNSMKASAYAINKTAQVVGSSDMGFGYNNAVIWRENMPDRPDSLGTGVARAISDSGLVVGQSEGKPVLWDCTPIPWSVSSGESISSTNGTAYGVNDSEQVVGDLISGDTTNAFVWNRGGQVQNLGAGSARAIDDDGRIVGCTLIGGVKRACIWSGGTKTDIGKEISPTVNTEAVSINSTGQILVNVYGSKPVIWSDGSATSLNSLYAANPATGYDINVHGQAVGTCAQRAVIWESGHVTDLNAQVPSGTPWLMEARAINDDGKIVCVGGSGEAYRVFLLTPVNE